MPKGVYKKGSGYKVCEKPPKSKCYSKKPLSKKRAEAQFRAIMANSARESYMNKVDKLIEKYTHNEQVDPGIPSELEEMKEQAKTILDTIKLWDLADETPIDPVYSNIEEYRDAQISRLGREIRGLVDLYQGLGRELP